MVHVSLLSTHVPAPTYTLHVAADVDPEVSMYAKTGIAVWVLPLLKKQVPVTTVTEFFWMDHVLSVDPTFT